MTREQIDRICTWMGWAQVEYNVHMSDETLFYWADPKSTKVGHWAAYGTFDPSTNLSDCARVMDEVVKQAVAEDINFGNKWSSFDSIHRAWVQIGEVTGTGSSKESESEAKMNAVLAMIEGRA